MSFVQAISLFFITEWYIVGNKRMMLISMFFSNILKNINQNVKIMVNNAYVWLFTT